MRCMCFMFYKEHIANPLKFVDFHFVVVKDLEHCVKRVLREYKGWSKDNNSLPLAFDYRGIVLIELLKQEIGSWRILPLVPPEITHDDVSNYQPGRRIPHCAFELQLLPEKPFERLFHQINIFGARSPASFYIRYPQPEENKIIAIESATSFAEQQQFKDAGNLTVLAVAPAVPQTPAVPQITVVGEAMQQAGQTVRLIGQEKKEQLAITYGEDVHSFEGDLASTRKKAEEFLSALDTVRFKYQKQDQQYIKVKDDYDALQEKVCILKADNDQLQEVKEELQQEVSLLTTRKDELFEALEQTEKTCNAKDVLISKLKSELNQAKRNLLSAFVGKPVQADYHAMAPDFLRGVDVFAEIVLEVVGDKPQKLEWPGYGFFIEVPEGSLPPEVTANVAVKIIAGGQFQFPENRQLISALYWIFSSELFLKEVAVNIQHCAVIKNEEQCSTLKFIIAKCSQEVLPYRFKEREGLFNPHTQYGTIKLKQFSILGETAPVDAEKRCAAFMFYKEQIPDPMVVNFHFVVVKDLKPYLQRVHNEYQEWTEDNDSLSICFNSKTVLRLGQQEQVIDPWKILPRSPPEITNDAVSYYEPGRRIPHCAYILQLLPGKSPQLLLHKVDLIGVPFPTFFHICFPQRKDDIVKPTRATTPSSDTPATTGISSINLSSSVSLSDSHRQQSVQGPLWNQPISDEAHLAKIATLINDWRAISPFLGLTNVDESAILGGAAQSVSAQTVAMLRRWKQKQGVKATYKQLQEMFEECKRADLVEVIEQLVAGLSEETTHESVTQQDQQAATEMSLEESPERSELMTAQENN